MSIRTQGLIRPPLSQSQTQKSLSQERKKSLTGIKSSKNNDIDSNLEKVKDGAIIEEKDSFDMLNFSNDLNLAGVNLNQGKELEERLNSTL